MIGGDLDVYSAVDRVIDYSDWLFNCHLQVESWVSGNHGEEWQRSPMTDPAYGVDQKIGFLIEIDVYCSPVASLKDQR